VRIAEYGPDRRADVADLMARVWGERPAEAELEWLYERNPVRPASVLLGEEDGRVVASVAISFLRMWLGGENVEVGMPIGLATDRAYQGRGLFTQLQEANEERARELGIRLLLIVPNAASAPVLVRRLGWREVPPLRVWARVRVLPRGASAYEIDRFADVDDVASDGIVRRDDAWMNWRFCDGPRRYRRFVAWRDGEYAIFGRARRGVAFVAAFQGDALDQALGAIGERAVVATVPPPDALFEGWLPTPRTFTVLGKSLHPSQPLPARPRFELGDLDFV
jgi:GNAT superfamily N-acetyltransferase